MNKLGYFAIQEFVPPSAYKDMGERCVELMDDRIITIANQLREQFGPVIINTWHSDTLIKAYGLRTESGWREPDSKTGAKRSQHKFGRAIDCLFKDTSAKEVRKFVLANKSKFPNLNCIEENVSWFHGDCRNVTPIKIIYP